MRCANFLTAVALVLAPVSLVAAQEPNPTSSTSTQTLTLTVSRVVATATVTTENPATTSSGFSTAISSPSLSGVVMNTTTTSTTADYTSFHYSAPSGAPTGPRNGTAVNPTGQPPVVPATGAASTLGGGLIAASLMGLLTFVLADAL